MFNILHRECLSFKFRTKTKTFILRSDWKPSGKTIYNNKTQTLRYNSFQEGKHTHNFRLNTNQKLSHLSSKNLETFSKRLKPGSQCNSRCLNPTSLTSY